MFGSIMNVRPGTAQTYEHLQSGFSFRVVGDGKVESELLDRFQSSSTVAEHLDDRRLRAFAAQQMDIAQKLLPEAESRQQLQELIEKHLGNQWEISDFMSRGGKGIGDLEVRLNEPGAGEQTFRVDNRDRSMRLQTSCMKDGWSVSHTISGKQGEADYQESATFQRG